MKDLIEIIESMDVYKARGEPYALATVVKVAGSTYRRPGARMFLGGRTTAIGAVSGGCLESDIVERASGVVASGQPITVTYDTSTDNDIIMGLGIGCEGVIEVLIELLPAAGSVDYHAFLKECISEGHTGLLATVFAVNNIKDTGIGNRLILRQNDAITDDIDNPKLRDAVITDARQVVLTGISVVKDYRIGAGAAEVLLEVIRPPVSLLVFGAGHDASPVVQIAKYLGWRATVVDSREAYADTNRFPHADRIVICQADEVVRHVALDARTVAVVMTHNYRSDRVLLQTLLNSPVRYVGALGPRSRTERLVNEMKDDGFSFTPEQLDRLFSPIGLDIGAETPEEIALSIIGEIQAFLNKRKGGWLKDRRGPIHDVVA